MEDVIVVSNPNDQRISKGFLRAGMIIAFAHRNASDEIKKDTLKISKYVYQILASLLGSGKAVSSCVEKRIQTAPESDPVFDQEFDLNLFQECFSATREALKDICLPHA